MYLNRFFETTFENIREIWELIYSVNICKKCAKMYEKKQKNAQI
jgi:hypothetical protein